jgi:Protein of unknown function (DUF3037)
VSGREDFQYAILRIVPHVERGECLNAGVVLFSRRHGFIGARTGLDAAALAAVAPDCEANEVRAHLSALERVAAGAPDGGPIATLEPSERFHWLTAPSSTIVQASPVHTGMTSDPAAELDHLFELLVAR